MSPRRVSLVVMVGGAALAVVGGTLLRGEGYSLAMQALGLAIMIAGAVAFRVTGERKP